MLNNPTNLYDLLGLVDKSYTPPHQTDLTDWEKTYNPPETYDIAGHGDSENMYDNDMLPMTPEEVADDIVNDPNYKPGTPVRLISCNTGRGKKPFAKKLAEELEKKTGKPTKVTAPTKVAYPGSKPGASPRVHPFGRWKNFNGSTTAPTNKPYYPGSK